MYTYACLLFLFQTSFPKRHRGGTPDIRHYRTQRYRAEGEDYINAINDFLRSRHQSNSIKLISAGQGGGPWVI